MIRFSVTAPGWGYRLKLFQKHFSARHFSVLKLVLIYAFFGTTWIYCSDTFLGWLVKDPEIITRIAVLKGFFFIVSTSVLLYFLVNAYADRLTKAAVERRQAEDQLAISDQSLRAILQASPVGIGRVKDRKLEWANEALCRIIGYRLEEIQGQTSRILYDNEVEFERVGNALYSDGAIETKWVRKDGQIRSVSVQTVQTSDLAFIFTAMDITERLNLETQLRQAQKMEAVGTFAGGVAHDFNNILTVMLGFSTLIRAGMDRSDPLQQHVDQVISSGQKAANLTRSLLAFSRKQTITLAPMSMNHAIRSTEKMLKRLLTEDIELVVSLSPDDIIIMADSTQFDQILFNFATNARDAMKRGGRLTISTTTFRMDGRFRELHGYGEPGNYGLLSVSDTGCGMTESTIQKIFDPFFTTKELGKGTGLGLSTVYGIVKQHKGYIDVLSQPGKGATFSVYLPALSCAVQEERTPGPAIKGGNEVILIAEDDAGVRSYMKETLATHGYSILEAENGQDAIDRYNEGVHLVILDSVMPKKNGIEAYDTIKTINPHAKTLFMSGYTRDVVLEKGVEEGKFDFISKPILPDELLKKVRDVLDR